MVGLPCVGWVKLSVGMLDTVENWPEKVNRGRSGGGVGVGASAAVEVGGVSEVGEGAITVVAVIEGAECELFCRMAKAAWSLKNA